MLPSSHVIPIKGSGPDSLPNPQLLADAFSEFISASSVLEASYRDLQQEVSRLSTELTKRNAALSSSLADNDRMRVAVQQMLDSSLQRVYKLFSAFWTIAGEIDYDLWIK